MLLCVELMFFAISLNFIFFSLFTFNVLGQIFALFTDGRLDEIFIQNEIGFSRIGDIKQYQKDREMICPSILFGII